MNARKARMLRQAAGFEPGSVASYLQPQIHHLVEFPVFETHKRVIRAWDPKAGKIVGHEVEKVRYRTDGKTPLKPLVSWQLDEQGELVVKPQVMLVPVAAPRLLKPGSPRRVYKALKRLARIGVKDLLKPLKLQEVGSGQ